ncbi:MAG: cupin domain-containing protein [Acidobacteriota bacterium]|nr:cupin domain-containing protein [Acidobacteriota bacterium]
MDQYNWGAIPEEKLNDLASRRVIHTEFMTVARLRLLKGAIVPMHHHVNEQITMLESGALRFEVAGEQVLVRAGDVLRIPPGAPHMVETLEDSMAVDLFTPPREDWIRGDDAYLRKPAGK